MEESSYKISEQIHGLINHILPERITRLSGYKVQPHDGLIKLDAMESPYSWGVEQKELWLTSLAQAQINLYPDSDSSVIKQKFHSILGLTSEQDILFGNGSDELIQLLLLGVYRPGETLVDLSPSFVMYRHIAQTIGYHYHPVDLNADFSINLEPIIEAIQTYQPKILFIARPNNPTANAFDLPAIQSIIHTSSMQPSPGLIVIDEAYTGFCQDDCLAWLHAYPNLLIMRTMSKMGLAGLRFGLLIGNKTWLDQFNKIRLPYNINSLTQISMDFALTHIDTIYQQVAMIRNDRDKLYKQLQLLEGIEVFPSQTNFILLKTHKIRAQKLFNHLLENGILVKNLDQFHPLTRECLRITIGKENDNQRLLELLRSYLNTAAPKTDKKAF